MSIAWVGPKEMRSCVSVNLSVNLCVRASRYAQQVVECRFCGGERQDRGHSLPVLSIADGGLASRISRVRTLWPVGWPVDLRRDDGAALRVSVVVDALLCTFDARRHASMSEPHRIGAELAKDTGFFNGLARGGNASFCLKSRPCCVIALFASVGLH